MERERTADLAVRGRRKPPTPGRVARSIALALLAVVALSSSALRAGDGASAAATKPPERPSVLLVTIDTLRADRLAQDGPMPRLWKLAQLGYRFTTAHSPVPLTLPAHTSILTGLGPQHHGVRDNIGYALAADVPTLAEAFAAKGWSTAAFVSGYPLDHAFGLSRGFDVYDDRLNRKPADGRLGHTERRADQTVDAALAWLAKTGDAPFLLWVHVFDVHDPYEAPAPFRGGHDSPYDDEAAFADDALGRLFDVVRAREGGPPWIFVTADHGESLGEHGEATHGIFLYDSTLHVPLVVAPPGSRGPGVALDAPVSLEDLAPTILEAAGLAPFERSDGRSLLPALDPSGSAKPLDPRPLYLESIHGRQRYGWSPLAGFLDWPKKFVAAPSPELYDLQRDPHEAENAFRPAREAALRARLEEIRGPGPDEASAAVPEGVDLKKLASLGYVGGSAMALSEEALYDRPRPDPKERVAAVPLIELGRAAMIAGRNIDARKHLEAALRLDPDNLVTLTDLGLLALRGGRTDKAAEYFREGLRRDVNAEALANNLGLALGTLERFSEAERAFRRALSIRPTFTTARYNLAFMLQRQGRSRQALKELERVRVEEPDFPGLNAFIEEVRGSIESPSAP